MDEQVPESTAKLEQMLANKGGKYLMASFSDMHGVSKTKIVPLGLFQC